MSFHPIVRLLAALRPFARRSFAAIASRDRPDAQTFGLRRRYRAALAVLPEDQRMVFILHRVEELTVADIATRLTMPTYLVEEHLAAALLAISTALDAPR